MISWMFPEIQDDTIDLSKFQEEVWEFKEAYEKYEKADNKEDRLALVSEGLDVIHSVETVLRKCGVDYSELQDGVNYVTMKNKLRGYYAKDNRPTTRKNQVQ